MYLTEVEVLCKRQEKAPRVDTRDRTSKQALRDGVGWEVLARRERDASGLCSKLDSSVTPRMCCLRSESNCQSTRTTHSPWIFPETPSALLSVPWLLILPLTPGFSFLRLQHSWGLQDVAAWRGPIGCRKEWRMPHLQACPDAPMKVISTRWTHPDSCLADSTWRSWHILFSASPSLSNTKSTREEKEGKHSLEDSSFNSFLKSVFLCCSLD